MITVLRCVRSAGTPGFSPAFSLPLEWLLAEVARRQQLLKQLSAALTPDTAVVRNPQMTSPSVQVSARQWALLIRVKDGTTPRDLAWELNGSVFGTTVEVSRAKLHEHSTDIAFWLITAAQHILPFAGRLKGAGQTGREVRNPGRLRERDPTSIKVDSPRRVTIDLQNPGGLLEGQALQNLGDLWPR